MKTFNMVRNHFESCRNHIRQRVSTSVFEATMNLTPIGVLCCFVNQIFKVKCFAEFNVIFNKFLIIPLLL